MSRYRTYDDWKLASPDDERADDQPFGECDCCGKKRPLTQCWLGELETWACEECSE